jgi:UDP-glucose 4-epimerase
VNIFGLLNVLQNCTRVGTRKIIFAGSGASYGTPTHLPIDEDSQQRPESPYGITKMATEHYLHFWQEAHDLNYTIFRYGNVYGPRQDPNGEAGVIAIFAQRFLNNQEVRIDWDGEQQKDYVFVLDVARANLMALDKGDNEIFCIGSGKGTSVNEIYETLAKITGNHPQITHAPRRPGDIYRSYFSYERAKHVFGWEPSVTFEEGVRAVVEFFRK